MRSKRSVLLALALGAVAVAATREGLASVFVQEDIDSLKDHSEAVVHARVVEARSYWNQQRTMIFTDVTLAVEQSLRGARARRIVVRVPGGTVDGLTVETIGAPRFEVGTEVVTFIARWRDGVPMVAGYFQGVSRVERDAAGQSVLRGGAADGVSFSDLARRLAGPAR